MLNVPYSVPSPVKASDETDSHSCVSTELLAAVTSPFNLLSEAIAGLLAILLTFSIHPMIKGGWSSDEFSV